MRKLRNQIICAALAAVMLTGLMAPAAMAATGAALDSALADTAEYVAKTVKSPQVASVGGEWAVLGLARSGYDVPDGWYQQYYATLEEYVRACDGVLHTKKYTEYSRVTLALTAMGRDPRDVAGYNLLTPLGDYEKTIYQGLNGPTFALIALDSGEYPMPENSAAQTQATREMYVNEILRRQLNNGGFSLGGGTTEANKNDAADADVTAMALQALAKYQDREDVLAATERALECLSKMQRSDGGFISDGKPNVESAVQVVVALGELGIPLDDTRFTKNGKTALDALLSYRREGAGFRHAAEDVTNQMATEQGLYGLAAAIRAYDGRNSLYRMTDAVKVSDPGDGATRPGAGLPGKHADVHNNPITAPGKTFEDIENHTSRPAIEALASRAIVNGRDENSYDPGATMTRAEFCAIVVRSLGLPQKTENAFNDVQDGIWYEGFVGAAYSYGIVNGTSETTFNPDGTITKQEASLMVMRAAGLAGITTAMTDGEIRDMLAQFGDYTTSAAWARSGLAFCYAQDFFDQSDFDINPLGEITRAEMAEILFRMLGAAKLL